MKSKRKKNKIAVESLDSKWDEMSIKDAPSLYSEEDRDTMFTLFVIAPDGFFPPSDFVRLYREYCIGSAIADPNCPKKMEELDQHVADTLEFWQESRREYAITFSN